MFSIYSFEFGLSFVLLLGLINMSFGLPLPEETSDLAKAEQGGGINQITGSLNNLPGNFQQLGNATSNNPATLVVGGFSFMMMPTPSRDQLQSIQGMAPIFTNGLQSIASG